MEALLRPCGQVNLSYEVLGEPRFIDLWFQPDPQPRVDRGSIDLGLLGTLTQAPCLLEPYRNSPDFDDIRSCISKRLAFVARQKRQNTQLSESN